MGRIRHALTAGSRTARCGFESESRAAIQLSSQAGAALCRVVDEALMQSPMLAALDLSAVTRINDSGIDALVLAAQMTGESDIALFLVGAPSAPVATVLGAWIERALRVFGVNRWLLRTRVAGEADFEANS
jgi:hypothetical protein